MRSLLLLCLLAASCTAQQKQEATKKPNIVLILADDLGYGDVGCFGQTKIHTPYLDSLATRGIRLTQFYAGTTVCAPSRSSLMTGQHTGHTPIRGNREIQPEGQWPLPDTVSTIAEILQKAGYATGAFGKWGLGAVGSVGDPVKRGFGEFFGYNCQRQSHNFFPDHLWHNDQRIDYPNTPDSQNVYAAQEIQERALAFIDAHKEEPFFLFLPYTLPHAALQLPAGDSTFEYYKKAFNEQPRPVPATWDGKGYQPQAYPHAAYAAMVSRLDTYAGQVLHKLRDLGLDSNTIVIFTSDNGPHQEGGHDPDFFKSNGPFRGIKRDVYEGGIHEPMIVSWPGHIRPGATSEHVGAFWDFMPTFAELAGVAAPSQTDGISFLPALTGKGTQRQHDYLYWEFHEKGGRRAVRMGNWKAVQLDVIAQPDGPVELYQLDSDPGEEKDVAAQHPEIVEKMRALMREAHRPNSAFPKMDGQ
ncbi:arylsulfatase [Chitinophaga cymbidii]|uniref:Arylsulfatase n=1 Tax=Chitinophaga cymbidii TaxID=1096750 RepID=A0A512RP84_9BACT|nr:arylsulfatase [Chitinophaga cymbidii]GEP97510.1 arylsulfatase [Chitinophaga cymbidii]